MEMIGHQAEGENLERKPLAHRLEDLHRALAVGIVSAQPLGAAELDPGSPDHSSRDIYVHVADMGPDIEGVELESTRPQIRHCPHSQARHNSDAAHRRAALIGLFLIGVASIQARSSAQASTNDAAQESAKEGAATTDEHTQWKGLSPSDHIRVKVAELKSRPMSEHPAIISDMVWNLHNQHRQLHRLPTDGDRTSLTDALLSEVNGLTPSDPSYMPLKLEALDAVTRFGDNGRGRQFVLDALEKGTEKERDQVLKALRDSASPMSSGEKWQEVEKLYESRIIDQRRRLFVLKALDPKKAYPLHLDALAHSSDNREFFLLAESFQSYKEPSLMHDLLPLVFARNLLSEPIPGHDGIRWLSNKALANYLAIAPDSDLPLLLDVIAKRPCHPDFCLAPMRDRRLLVHRDPRVRQETASYLGTLARTASIDLDVASQMISDALKTESDPGVQRALRVASQEVDHGRDVLRKQGH